MYPVFALMTMKRGAYPLHLEWKAEVVYPSLDALNNKVDVDGDNDSAVVCKVDVVSIVEAEYIETTTPRKDNVNSLDAFCSVMVDMAFNSNVTISFEDAIGNVPEIIPDEESSVIPVGKEVTFAYVTVPAPCVASTVLVNAVPLLIAAPNCPEDVVHTGNASEPVKLKILGIFWYSASIASISKE